MNGLSSIALGLLGSLAAGSLTAVGAVPVLFGKVPWRSTRDTALGFAAGVMLAASFLSLFFPALEAAEPMFENGAMPAALTGPVEPVGGLPGAGIMTLSRPLLPWGLAFAAGAMLYVISREIIPETHRSGHQNRAALGLAIGLVLMLFLDVRLG